MSNCIVCGAKNKTTIGNETIRTRIPEMEEIVVEDVLYDQCTICDNKVITESSEQTVKKIGKYYMDRYYNQNMNTSSVVSTTDTIKDFFKKIGVFN